MEKPRINILGASGHGKVVADIAKLNGYTEIYFYDDDETLEECDGYPVVGTKADFNNAIGHLFVAIGNAKTRRRVMEMLRTRDFPLLIHPKATVAERASIKCGTVVMAGAVINTDAKLGCGCIINTGSTVDHDCVIGDYCHIAVGSHLCGAVIVGESTWIGAGATVSNNVNICGDCVIGAGAVVIKDVSESGTYVGVPVKKNKDEM